MSDEQVDPSDLSPILKETAAKGKPLTEKERRKFEALEADIRKCEKEIKALQIQHSEGSSGVDPTSSSRRPKPEDFGLPASDVQSIENAIKGGMRINRFLSWLLYALAILGGVVVWKASNGLYALTMFFWFLLMGLTASDSKRLIKLWNYRQRHLINAYYQLPRLRGGHTSANLRRPVLSSGNLSLVVNSNSRWRICFANMDTR